MGIASRRGPLAAAALCLALCGCARHAYRGQEMDFDTKVGVLLDTAGGRYIQFDAELATLLLTDYTVEVPEGMVLLEHEATAEPGSISWTLGNVDYTAQGAVVRLTGRVKIRENCPTETHYIVLKLPALPIIAVQTRTVPTVQKTFRLTLPEVNPDPSIKAIEVKVHGSFLASMFSQFGIGMLIALGIVVALIIVVIIGACMS